MIRWHCKKASFTKESSDTSWSKCVVSHLPNHFSICCIQPEHNILLLCIYMKFFIFFPCNFGVSWGVFLSIKHVHTILPSPRSRSEMTQLQVVATWHLYLDMKKRDKKWFWHKPLSKWTWRCWHPIRQFPRGVPMSPKIWFLLCCTCSQMHSKPFYGYSTLLELAFCNQPSMISTITWAGLYANIIFMRKQTPCTCIVLNLILC